MSISKHGPPPGSAKSETKLNEDATLALSLSKGRQLVPLEDMCPATFNRFGDHLRGNHCLYLLQQMIKLKGFAVHKYVAGYLYCQLWKLIFTK